jgi:predicted nucleic acid-binding protein
LRRIILDASVAAKWVLPQEAEALRTEARAVLKAHEERTVALITPELFWAEMGNLLWKACRRGELEREVARRQMDALLALGLTTQANPSLAAHALGLALAYDRTVYDATYLATALDCEATLLTADERLVNAVRGKLPVTWLGDWR